VTDRSGQAAADLIGAWHLNSYESRDSSGATRYPLGRGVIGQLVYDASGHMSAMLMTPDRPLFASQDPQRGTDAEVRAAFDGFIAYFGSYSVAPLTATVTHHVIGASYPNWVGGHQVRHYKLDGTHLELSTPPIQIGGQSLITVLVWERSS
jgi:Lipocalin-like domain